ncbi:hypothetical protein N7497_008632 [Penicillium chrysogenum]|nr:hypothetical protein N7497_008632 [Penicillium chrysogenum]
MFDPVEWMSGASERMHEEDGSAMSKEKILRYSSGVASRKLQRRTGKQYFGSRNAYIQGGAHHTTCCQCLNKTLYAWCRNK